MVRPLEPDLADALANELLAKFGSLAAVLAEPPDALASVTGSPVLAAILSSTKNVVIESLLAELPKEPFSASNQDVVRYLCAIMDGLTHEEAHVFFLDGKLRFLRHEVFAFGSETNASFPMRMIFRRAMLIGASQLVLIHNHPSGIPEPSASDIAVTHHISAAGQAVDIGIHDHLIVAGPHVYSFRSAGLL